jgi:hypothetical protein
MQTSIIQRFLFLVLCFGLIVSVAYAQEAVPTHPIDGKYIKEWLVLGPFFPDDLETDFLAQVGGEANISPQEDDNVDTGDGRTLVWKHYASSADMVNLHAEIGEYEKVTAYALCSIISPKAETLEARLQSNDYVKVWLNGEPVHANLTTHGGDIDLFPVPLKAGVNRCLLKIGKVQAGGYWNFSLQLWNEKAYHRAVQLEVTAPKQFDFETQKLKLAISAQRVPESIMFKLPPSPVTLEMRDSTQKVLLKKTQEEGQQLVWNVPDDFEGEVQIVARQIDASAKIRKAEITTSTREFVREKTDDWRKYIPRAVER